LAVWFVPRGGLDPLLWGTGAGIALQLLALNIVLARYGHWRLPRLGFTSPLWATVSGGLLLIIGSQAIGSFAAVADQLFASALGQGNVSSLSYANRLLALVVGMLALAISRATLPAFSEVHARTPGQLHRTAVRWATGLFAVCLVAIVPSWLLAPSIVQLMFERGAFTATQTAQVSTIFQWSLLQVPFYAFGLVVVSALSSQGRLRGVALTGILNLPLKLVLNALLVPWLGVNGIVISTLFVYMVSACVLYYFLRPAKRG
jgi:putative peptidoglycan lipid II flippase